MISNHRDGSLASGEGTKTYSGRGETNDNKIRKQPQCGWSLYTGMALSSGDHYAIMSKHDQLDNCHQRNLTHVHGKRMSKKDKENPMAKRSVIAD